MDPFFFIDSFQSLADGMLYGSTYALIGLGFTLIFGVMHKINLSYAAASIGGAYASILVLQSVSAPVFVVFLLAALAGGIIGLLVYFACFHFISPAQPLAMLMATLGMLLFIDEVVIHGTNGVPISFPAMTNESIVLGDFYFRGDLIAVFVVAGLSWPAFCGSCTARSSGWRRGPWPSSRRRPASAASTSPSSTRSSSSSPGFSAASPGR